MVRRSGGERGCEPGNTRPCPDKPQPPSAGAWRRSAGAKERRAEARQSTHAAAEESEEARFYFNKIKTAEHYVFQILPRAQAVMAKVQSRNFAALEALL